MKNIQHTLERKPVLKRMMLLVGTLIVILLCTFALSTLATAKHTQAAQRGTQTTYESIRIAGGDSLWSIAQQYHGIEETADFVEELKVLNNLSSDRIQAGSYLLVPVTSVM
ncbi:MAG: LysM peptidoglycan-binding domain-containing protein [Lachnospiraceae bacterium]|nr:LysM peptidoglycan-binding domain-containing protein [Lachnospiraceae bacterium]